MNRSISRPNARDGFGRAPVIHDPQLPPDFAEIRRRVQEICAEQGGLAGMTLNDWLQAEQKLKPRPTKNNHISHRKIHL